MSPAQIERAIARSVGRRAMVSVIIYTYMNIDIDIYVSHKPTKPAQVNRCEIQQMAMF